jgi:hypothetical protein
MRFASVHLHLQREGTENPRLKKSCGLRHPELGSGSEASNRQMLKQVQHDKRQGLHDNQNPN